MKPLTLTPEETKQLSERFIGGVDKWYRMFMGIASELISVKDGVIQLQIVYSNSVNGSKAETVARSWLKAPKNAVLRKAETVEVLEYTDTGTPGAAVILDDEDEAEDAEEYLDSLDTASFGETKTFYGRKVFVVSEILSS